MDHIAIMKKSWKFTDKILSGEKTIESRWYTAKYTPWDRIHSGDAVFFKDSGEPVTVQAEVVDVEQISELDKEGIKNILEKYWECLGIEKKNIPKFYEQFKDKKYCILIHLKNPRKIEPFDIDKTGYVIMSAWIVVEDIKKIKK